MEYQMRIYPFLTVLVTITVAALSTGCPEKKDDTPANYIYPDPEPKHCLAYKKEGWALYIDYRAHGTRSEGIDGRLYHDGKEVKGKKVVDTIDTPLAKMTWKGEKEDYKEFHTWDPTGWFSDNSEHMRRFDRTKDKCTYSITCVYPSPEPKHCRAYKKECWALYIDYRAHGTRSEGIDGRLYHDGKQVKGKKVGETIDTPLAKMTWKGEKEDYKEFRPWDPTGWFSDNSEHMHRFDRTKDKCNYSTTCVYPNPEPNHYRAHKKEGWALYINYRAPGTKSEGIDGRLFHKCREIKVKRVGETMDTPLAKMTWKGEKENYGDKFQLWLPTGWYSDNPLHMRRFDRTKDKIP
jgi:hypothetical protein